MPFTKIIELANESYSCGELDRTMGYVQVLMSLELSADFRSEVIEMMEKCLSVMKRYSDLPLWKDFLAKEKSADDEKICEYYS